MDLSRGITSIRKDSRIPWFGYGATWGLGRVIIGTKVTGLHLPFLGWHVPPCNMRLATDTLTSIGYFLGLPNWTWVQVGRLTWTWTEVISELLGLERRGNNEINNLTHTNQTT